MTEAEVLSHPLYRGFGPLADDHPPMRGWLATSICDDHGRVYGMLQLSDKTGGRDFDEADDKNIHELVALIGATLDALRLAAESRRRRAPRLGLRRGAVYSPAVRLGWVGQAATGTAAASRIRSAVA